MGGWQSIRGGEGFLGVVSLGAVSIRLSVPAVRTRASNWHATTKVVVGEGAVRGLCLELGANLGLLIANVAAVRNAPVAGSGEPHSPSYAARTRITDAQQLQGPLSCRRWVVLLGGGVTVWGRMEMPLEPPRVFVPSNLGVGVRRDWGSGPPHSRPLSLPNEDGRQPVPRLGSDAGQRCGRHD